MHKLLVAAAVLLSACAGPGGPTAVVAMPGGGQRLQYSLQPTGQEAWMVDVDASGKELHRYQALTFDNFNRIQPGWTVADIQREFGPPAKVDRVMSWQGPVWTYRWRDVANSDMFYYVYFDEHGIVARAHQGMELRNFRSPFR
ncbi:MAG TPA: hypothetical protein VMZ74_15305 [Ramlibacter sp.]|nr:hypothetical protein [Ramlibacter sp.]